MNDQELTISTLETALGRPLSPAERLQACNDCGGLLAALDIDRINVPRQDCHGGFYVERTGLLFGYEVEKSEDAGSHVGYYLHGPRVTYKLMRRVNHPQSMYVVNSKGNISSIRGNYSFSDADGRLRATL